MSTTQEAIAQTIGERVRGLRTELGWSQERLAREIEASHMTIVRLEAGQNIPKWDTLERLAEALRTTIPYLLGYSDERHNPG